MGGNLSFGSGAGTFVKSVLAKLPYEGVYKPLYPQTIHSVSDE